MRHHARVYRFVARQTGSEIDGRRHCERSFSRIVEAGPAFEGRSEVTTWLLGIARFKALSHLRKRKEEAIDEETRPRSPTAPTRRKSPR